MAEQGSTGGSGSLFSLNTLLAVVTLVGGVVLVSHRLTSERPKRPSPGGTEPLGFQNIESRLWEDPFAAWDKLYETQRVAYAEKGLGVLTKVLTNDVPAGDTNNLLILGVMVSGQPYAEDQETRIRARFAI